MQRVRLTCKQVRTQEGHDSVVVSIPDGASLTIPHEPRSLGGRGGTWVYTIVVSELLGSDVQGDGEREGQDGVQQVPAFVTPGPDSMGP